MEDQNEEASEEKCENTKITWKKKVSEEAKMEEVRTLLDWRAAMELQPSRVTGDDYQWSLVATGDGLLWFSGYFGFRLSLICCGFRLR